MTTVTVNGLGQFNNTIQSGDIGRDLVAADVVGPNSEIDVNGIGNVVFLGLGGPSPDGIIRLTGINNEAVIFSSPHTMTFLNGVGNTAVVSTTTADIDNTVSVLGVNNIVRLTGVTPDTTPGDVVVDHGLGTIIEVQSTDLTIKDFQHDPTGIVDLSQIGATPAQAVAAERSDGHGGTVLTLNHPAFPGFPTTTIDFAGDPHVDISHFV